MVSVMLRIPRYSLIQMSQGAVANAYTLRHCSKLASNFSKFTACAMYRPVFASPQHQLTLSSRLRLSSKARDAEHRQKPVEVVSGERIRAGHAKQEEEEGGTLGVTPQGLKLTYTDRYGFLVYEGRKVWQAKFVKRFGVVLGASWICLLPVMIQNIYTNMGGNTVMLVLCGVMTAFATFVQPSIVHAYTKRYPSRIYYNYDTHVFTVKLTDFFGFDRMWQFKAVDTKPVNTMFTTFRVPATRVNTGNIRIVPLLIEPASFYDRDAYIYMMQYDKPMDINLETQAKQEREAKREELESELEREIHKLNVEFAKKLVDAETNKKHVSQAAGKECTASENNPAKNKKIATGNFEGKK